MKGRDEPAARVAVGGGDRDGRQAEPDTVSVRWKQTGRRLVASGLSKYVV